MTVTFGTTIVSNHLAVFWKRIAVSWGMNLSTLRSIYPSIYLSIYPSSSSAYSQLVRRAWFPNLHLPSKNCTSRTTGQDDQRTWSFNQVLQSKPSYLTCFCWLLPSVFTLRSWQWAKDKYAKASTLASSFPQLQSMQVVHHSKSRGQSPGVLELVPYALSKQSTVVCILFIQCDSHSACWGTRCDEANRSEDQEWPHESPTVITSVLNFGSRIKTRLLLYSFKVHHGSLPSYWGL